VVYYRYFIYSLLVILFFTLTGCPESPEAKPQLQPKTKIGLILAENKSARNQYLAEKLKTGAENKKIKLIVGYSKLDVNEQESQIQKMIDEKAAAVIIQPLDAQVTKDHISKLIEHNIKIIVIDFLPKQVLVDAFITPDYVKAGELQAQYLISKGKQSQPIILKGNVIDDISEKVLQGNSNILRNNSLTSNMVIEAMDDEYAKKAYDALKKLSNFQPTAVISHYEETTLGIVKYINEMKMEKKIPILTLDLNKTLVSDAAKGDIIILDTMPNLLAQIILEVPDNLLKTNNWQYDLQINNEAALIPTKYTPVRIIDQENIELLKERFPELKNINEQKKQEEKPKQGVEQKQTKLKITTKDGKEYEVKIPGEIEKVEIEADKKQE